MKREEVWLDVSHIVNWPGNLTGVERVEFNLINYYYNNTDAGFVRWDDGLADFREVDRTFVKQAILERTSEQEQAESPTAPTKTLLSRVRHKLKQPKTGAQPLSVKPGVLIILAGLWDNSSYIRGVQKLATDWHIIHVVYDMIPLVQQGLVVDYLPKVFETYMYAVLPECKGILAISQATAKDTQHLLKTRGLKVPKIYPFRLGDEISRATTPVRPEGIPEMFILSVGTIEARKNHLLLYYLQKRLLEKKELVQPIVLVGKRGWLTDDFQYIIGHDQSVKDQLIIKDRVTDNELQWLYEHCQFTIFPSFYEGWGLPIAESLKQNKVTLSSNMSSMPEVGGELVDYFSPYSVDELAALVRKYNSADERKTRAAEIAGEYRPTSWEAAAHEFSQLVAKLLS